MSRFMQVGGLLSNEPFTGPEVSSEPIGETVARTDARRRFRRFDVPLVRLAILLTAVVLLIAFWDALFKRYQQSRARTLLNQRRDTAALDYLRAALRRDLNDPETVLLLARAHRRLGNLPKVTLLLDHAQARGGPEERIERERRLMLAQSGRLREVEPLLADMLMNPGEDGPDICQAFVQGYFLNLRSGDAEQLLDAWQQSYPEDSQVYFMRGYLMHSVDDFELAERLYRQGLELAPDQAAMRKRLAAVLLESGRLDEAEAELQLAIQYLPEDPEVHFMLARCAYEGADTASARSRLEATLRHAPDHFEARRLRGQLHLAEGSLDEALRDLEAAFAQRPYDLLAREALARALRAMDRDKEAQPHFAFVIEGQQSVERVNRLVRESLADPANAELRYEIGTIMMRYGSPDDAARWMRSVLQLQPQHAGAHHALAEYCQTRGDVAGATFHRQRAAASQQMP